jgi:GH25 family lysozyme M1 (1,4-beta-N-acetylmuramidase)
LTKKQSARKFVLLRASYGVELMEARLLLSRAAGIDVSTFQGNISWSTVKNSGAVDYAYARASYGTASQDTFFMQNATGAANAGMMIGFYHFAYYDLAGHTPALEASNFWNTIKPYIKADGKHLMPMLDIEEGTALGSGTGESSLTQWCKDWCTDIINDAAGVGLDVVPIIYSSSGNINAELDSTIPQTIPLWVADYTGTTTPQTSLPTAGTGRWQTWQMWQYSSTGSVSGISGNVDMDVLNGDTTVLKDYIVSSTSNSPNGRWAANTTVQTTSAVDAYATLADAQQQTSNFSLVAGSIVGTVLSGPLYGGSYQRYQVKFKTGVTGWVGEDFMQTAASPAAVTLTSPANNANLTAKPSFNWSASTLATSYDVYLDNTLQTNTTATSVTLGTIADGTHTWQSRAKNSQGTAAGSTFTFTLDTTPPTAALPAQSPAAGTGVFDFTVNYADATSGVDSTTIGAGDVTVTGPNFSQGATFKSYNTSTGVATYEITAPGALWNAAASGTYTVSQNASQVKDVFGNVRPSGSIGTFAFSTFAYRSGAALVVDYGTSAGSISLSLSGGNLVVTKNGSASTFSSASTSTITVSGSSANQTFTFNGPITQPVTVAMGTGSDVVNVAGGVLTLASDVSPATPNLTINISPGASLAITSVQHLAALNVTGATVTLASGGNNTLVTSALSLSNNAGIDLADNAMIINGGSSSLTAIVGWLASGFNQGAWDGAGIRSSSAAADGSMSQALGYALNSDLGYSTFMGQNVDQNALLIRYTKYGDNNLDGVVDVGNDFALLIDGLATANASSWVQGDYTYDGKVDLGNDANLFLRNYLAGAIPNAPAAQSAEVALAAPVLAPFSSKLLSADLQSDDWLA